MARAHQILALMMLDDHHRDVVELDRVGQGEQRPVGGADDGRLVVIDPVADIFDAGGGEDFRGVERFRQARDRASRAAVCRRSAR